MYLYSMLQQLCVQAILLKGHQPEKVPANWEGVANDCTKYCHSTQLYTMQFAAVCGVWVVSIYIYIIYIYVMNAIIDAIWANKYYTQCINGTYI